MDDIEVVIKAIQNFKYEKDEPEKYAFNRISDLPESKSNLKRAIKDRIRFLCASYISLASFIPDEDAEYLLGLHGEQKKKRSIKIMMRMLKEMDELEREMRDFDPFDLPTARAKDALDSQRESRHSLGIWKQQERQQASWPNRCRAS